LSALKRIKPVWLHHNSHTFICDFYLQIIQKFDS
jgi:hypothetical protein